ncbi:MAG TPA: hypothetical protein DIC22_09165 [Chitinophagaceae bacterium]|jgi:hypothetical protein|nr:hypothetical protein [Chitinophagaceae bacterium]
MKYLVLPFILFSAFTVQAQKVTGYWYGQANVEMAGIQNNYLTELIISQKGTRVKGFFGYYFKDVYQSFVVKGTFDPKSRKIIIHDIPIIYFRTNSTMNSVDCITSFYGTLRVSKVKTELVGHFYRDKKYTYTCPDLRVNYTLFTEAKVTDSIFKDMSSTRSFWKPQPPEPEVVKGNDAHRETEMQAIADPAADKARTRIEKSGSAEKTVTGQRSEAGNQSGTGLKSGAGDKSAITAAVKIPASPRLDERPAVQPDIISINESFKKRKLVVSKQIEVASDSVRLSFYDNAEVDGDSISVFLNGRLILAHQALSERAFNVYVQLDTNREINEVSMFAENLGKYPPNTALMVISDGDKRYETFLSSDFKGNATIRLKLRRNSVAGN